MLSLGLLLAIEVGSFLGRKFGPDLLDPLFARVTGEGYESLVGAGVGAIATFLGLYYATVGVVASTVYGSVPPGVRTLFVSEPSGVVYVRGVAYALVLGIAMLAVGSLGYRPTPIGLGVFAMLAIISVLRLLILGGRIFNFFDPTALSVPLLKRFAAAAKMASDAPTSLNQGSQLAAHDRAVAVLELYRQLAILLDGRKARDATGPSRLTRQALRLVTGYSMVKDRIPTESAWWGKRAEYANWLTVDHMRLNTAISTATGIQSLPVRDPLWVEGAVAEVLRLTLKASREARGSAGALAFADEVGSTVLRLAARLHMAEAITLERVWRDAVADITSTEPIETEQLTAHDAVINQLAAAEQVVVPMIQIWLGYVDAARRIGRQDLSASVRQALSSSRSLYASGLPATTVELLEQFSRKLELEVARESKRITPQWWIDHLVARSIATHLRESHDTIIAAIDPRVGEIVAGYVTHKRYDLAAVASIATLELLHKLEVHQAVVGSAFEALSRHRNSNTSLESWPDAPDDSNLIITTRATMFRCLAEALPHLRKDVHTSSEPDLYGQAYQFLLEATFSEILEGNSGSALPLFAALFREMNQVRSRLGQDLSDRDLNTRASYAAEPIVALMELSGYARFMQEVDGKGIWDKVRMLWDAALDADEPGTSVSFLLTAVQVSDYHVGFSRGGMARASRSQRFDALLKERGVRGRSWHNPLHGESEMAPASNPIFDLFAPGSYGGHQELADLFVADYLLERAPEGTTLLPRTQSVVESLRRSSGTENAGAKGSGPRTRPATRTRLTAPAERPDDGH